MNESRLWKFTVKAGALVLLGLPVVLLGLAGAEIALRLSRSRSFVTYQPCMHRGAGAAFLTYTANCTSTQETDHGLVTYHFNELGLRDRPIATFSQGAILALGDSITKGLYLDDGETIPALLEKSLGEKAKYPVLNAGIRYASPTTESLLYLRLRKTVHVKAVLLILNGTDTIDERLYQAMATASDRNGVPVAFSPESPLNPIQPNLLEDLYRFSRGHSYLAELLRQRMYYQRYVTLAEGVPAEKEVLCGAIFRLAQDLKNDGVPLLFVFTPLPPSGIERIWPGIKFVPAELQQMVSCAKSTGSPVVDLSGAPPDPSWYVGDALHSSPAGARWIVDRITPSAAELVSKLH